MARVLHKPQLGLERCFISTKGWPVAMAKDKGAKVRGPFLLIAGFIFVGVGAALYYGELGSASLTKSGAPLQSANAWGYLPAGLGVALMVTGILFAILDRRVA